MPQDSLPRRSIVEGAFNLRDLGGIATTDGRRVKAGVLYRSGTMVKVTDAGGAQMLAFGIRSIVDFRRRHECVAQPTRWHIGSESQYWTSEHDISNGELAELARSHATTAATMHAAMVSLYRELPHRHADSYRHMFELLLQEAIPLLFNCAAGKDRTGVAAALILHALGVPKETIFADYLLTNEADFASFVEAGSRYDSLQKPAKDRLFIADPAYLEAMYAELADSFGGIDTYIETILRLDATQRVMLRDMLLE